MILYIIVYFHHVLCFWDDLVGMVKIMQKICKREQKGSKDAKAKNPTARNMSTGWKSLRETCRQVWCGQLAARRPCARDEQCTARQPVDWIMQHVDWMNLPWKNQSTGMNMSTGWNVREWTCRHLWGRKFSRRNPSRRKTEQPRKSCAVRRKNQYLLIQEESSKVVNRENVANRLRSRTAQRSRKSNG